MAKTTPTPTGDPAIDAKTYIDAVRADNESYYAAHPEATRIPEHEYAAQEAIVRQSLEKLAALKPKLPDVAVADADAPAPASPAPGPLEL
jgi:hypothetical protein